MPNFDPPDKVCTFRRLLLSKCRDEFENRAHLALEKQTSSSPGTTAPGPGSAGGEDSSDEAKYMAKRKMLGNIKFIGELGKLQIVHDSILHQCCQKLLVGRKKQPISDQAEDLECLCHLMRTCGRILDTPKAKVDRFIIVSSEYVELIAAFARLGFDGSVFFAPAPGGGERRDAAANSLHDSGHG